MDSALFFALKALVDRRMSQDALAQMLDPEILALLMEETAPSAVDSLVEDVVNATLGAAQAKRRGVDSEPLRRLVAARAGQIADTVTDPALLPLYSSTGLTAAGCETLRASALQRAADLRPLLTGEREDLARVATLCLQACEGVSELAPAAEFAGSYEDLLHEWLTGTSIEELRSRFSDDAGSPDQLSKLIDTFFGYRLPWGTNSFLRIAASVLAVPSDELSAAARFIPSMIRYGVPIAPASWAITAGIPSRRLALDIATDYVSQSERPGYSDFMGWLAGLDPDDFRERFGVSGALLDDLAIALDRTALNPLLSEYPDSLSILPVEVRVSGAGRADRLSAAAQAGIGADLDVFREFGDPISRNAIAFRLDGQLLGFVPRREAQLLAPEIDSGTSVVATIAAVDTAARRVAARLALPD